MHYLIQVNPDFGFWLVVSFEIIVEFSVETQAVHHL
jgi:hypothetical protein